MPDRRDRPGATVPWRDPVVLAIVGSCVLAGAWYLVGWGGESVRSLGFGMSQPVFNLVLAVLCRRVARLPGLSMPTRRFWNSFALAGVCSGIGDLVQVILDLRDPSASSILTGTAHQIGLVVGVGFMVWAMLAIPTPSGSRREQLRFWLDASTVMAGASAFAWYFSISASVGSGAPAGLAGPVMVMALELVAAFGAVKLLLTGAAGFARGAVICGGLGAALEGVAAGIVPTMTGSVWLPLLVAAQVLPTAMITATPRIQELLVRADPGLLNPAPKRPYSLLPYLAVAATVTLHVVVLAADGMGTGVWGVLVGVVVSTSLVVARQLAAFSENASLLAQLEVSFRELARQEQLLRHQASHDYLTQLANRALFSEHARLSTGEADDPSAMIMIDLDDFKPINDTLGHHIGDAVLVAVADRLRDSVRPGDTVARFGGDEFAILLPATHAAAAERVVSRIATALAQPLAVKGHVLHVQASIGLATGSSGDPDALLRDADHAMYTAKRTETDRRHGVATTPPEVGPR